MKAAASGSTSAPPPPPLPFSAVIPRHVDCSTWISRNPLLPSDQPVPLLLADHALATGHLDHVNQRADHDLSTNHDPGDARQQNNQARQQSTSLRTNRFPCCVFTRSLLTEGIESTSWKSVFLSVCHHFKISNIGPLYHPRITPDPTYHILLGRGWCQLSSGDVNDTHKDKYKDKYKVL